MFLHTLSYWCCLNVLIWLAVVVEGPTCRDSADICVLQTCMSELKNLSVITVDRAVSGLVVHLLYEGRKGEMGIMSPHFCTCQKDGPWPYDLLWCFSWENSLRSFFLFALAVCMVFQSKTKSPGRVLHGGSFCLTSSGRVIRPRSCL